MSAIVSILTTVGLITTINWFHKYSVARLYSRGIRLFYKNVTFCAENFLFYTHFLVSLFLKNILHAYFSLIYVIAFALKIFTYTGRKAENKKMEQGAPDAKQNNWRYNFRKYAFDVKWKLQFTYVGLNCSNFCHSAKSCRFKRQHFQSFYVSFLKNRSREVWYMLFSYTKHSVSVSFARFSAASLASVEIFSHL